MFLLMFPENCFCPKTCAADFLEISLSFWLQKVLVVTLSRYLCAACMRPLLCHLEQCCDMCPLPSSVYSRVLKKSSQELYGLICYAELRKKVGGCKRMPNIPRRMNAFFKKLFVGVLSLQLVWDARDVIKRCVLPVMRDLRSWGTMP